MLKSFKALLESFHNKNYFALSVLLFFMFLLLALSVFFLGSMSLWDNLAFYSMKKIENSQLTLIASFIYNAISWRICFGVILFLAAFFFKKKERALYLVLNYLFSTGLAFFITMIFNRKISHLLTDRLDRYSTFPDLNMSSLISLILPCVLMSVFIYKKKKAYILCIFSLLLVTSLALAQVYLLNCYPTDIMGSLLLSSSSSLFSFSIFVSCVDKEELNKEMNNTPHKNQLKNKNASS